jgi:S-adenosylmethionine hydrolase
VDPGVGTERRPIALRVGRGDTLVGPDNGVLLPAAERLGGLTEARLIENPAWMLPRTSATFHGRDIFAPVAARLAIGGPFEDVGRVLDPAELVAFELPSATVGSGVLETEVLYVDSFGNLRLAGGTAELAAAIGHDGIPPGLPLRLELGTASGDVTAEVRWARTFGEVGPGDLLAYEDSSGNLAVAESTGSAAASLGAATGTRVRIRRA